MGKMLRNMLRAAFVSFLFVGVSLTSANAQENCPSKGNEVVNIFQEMLSDLIALRYQPIVMPEICSAVIQVVKEGESLNHGLANVTWQIKTYAIAHYVWTGRQYQFVHLVKLRTESRAPIGPWSVDSTSPESEEQEQQIVALFRSTYFVVGND